MSRRGARAITSEIDDNALVRAAQAGDRAALDVLLRRHHDRIYALCRRMTGNDADALDATQEAMITLVRGLHHFDGRAAFTTWSYRVVTNACLDELRRRKRRPDPGLPEYEQVDEAGPPPPEDQIADRLAIDEALGSLPDEYRAAVVLRDQMGMDYAAIGEVLEIPPGTVRSRIARGRAALADRLGNQGSPGDVSRSTP